MREPKPGDLFTCVADIEDDDLLAHSAVSDDGDVTIRGWLTTEQLNSYRQIVRTSTFDWKGGLSRWNGRILLEHGRRFLIGGGNGIPVGQFMNYEFIEGKGMFGTASIWKENPALLRRAIREGTMNALSIGFTVVKGGYTYHKKADKLEIKKGVLHEVSLCNVGVNAGALFEVVHSMRQMQPNLDTLTHNQQRRCYHITYKGVTYLVNNKGEVEDAG